jgi:3-dehydroquinate dehydratase/shikimate dehydrogenase
VKQTQPKLDRICGVVAAGTAAEMQRQLLEALRDTRTVELRLDWLRSDAERRRFLGWLRRRRLRAQCVATCRRREAGGRFPGGVSAQRAILQVAVDAGCQWYDVEIESLEVARRAGAPFVPISPAGNGRGTAQAIISLHRFDRPVDDPEALFAHFRGAPPGVWKLAVECRTLAQAIRLARLARRRPMITVPMGRVAFPVRLLALREGSLLSYAAVSQSTAPGQPGLAETTHLYRAGRIDGRTRVFGIIGNKTGHSVSPAMHNAAFAARGINAIYLPFLVDDLDDFLAAIGPLGIRGFSVTIPHKQAILPRLDSCDALARRLGAVNTVVVRGGRLRGYNTDYRGVVAALARRVRLPGSHALLVGAGGAARAAVFALADAGAQVSILARRAERARALAREAGAAAVTRGELRRRSFDLIVNATPLGMAPDRRSPLRSNELNAPVVFDMVYRPLRTPLLRLAAERGLRTISGVEMLVAQGVAQWELWTGRAAPARLMRRATLAALGAEKDVS